jgi:hypothetical protein
VPQPTCGGKTKNPIHKGRGFSVMPPLLSTLSLGHPLRDGGAGDGRLTVDGTRLIPLSAEGPGLPQPLCREPLTGPKRLDLAGNLHYRPRPRVPPPLPLGERQEARGDPRSACSSGVHSYFCAWHRLAPDPALCASLGDYYSPSQLLYSIAVGHHYIIERRCVYHTPLEVRPYIHLPQPSDPLRDGGMGGEQVDQ